MSAAPSRRPRVLLLGPLPAGGGAIGGTQVSFDALVRHARASDAFEPIVQSTSRSFEPRSRTGRAAANARSLVRTLRAIAAHGRSVDAVAFHASPGAVLAAGPLVWAACRAIGRPLCVRVFGGSLDLVLDAASASRRAIAERTVLRAELVLVQTQALVERFGSRENVRWMPTTRDLFARGAPRRDACRHFLFLAQLRPEKGVFEALRASDELEGDARLSVFGPPMPGFDPSVLERHARARWCGAIAPTELPRVLEEHDALVFPTWYAGEGLPGAVIEALQAGLPVIASRWRSVPDLVAHERNGLVVEPKDARGLAAAMRRLRDDRELYAALARGARRTGERYRASEWLARHDGWMLDLCARRAPAAGPSPASISAAATAGAGQQRTNERARARAIGT